MFEKELARAVDDAFTDFCPDDDDCPIHNRVDDMILREEEFFGSAITYVGKYVVMTGDSCSLSAQDLLTMVLSASLGVEAEVDPYEVAVIEVGDGTLANVRKIAMETQDDVFTRHVHSFRNWKDFVSEHEAMVQRVREGSVDLSGFPGK